MSFSGRLSIRSKLVILLLLASFASIAVVGYQGFRSARDALNEAIYNELTTLRAAKTQQVQAYFSDIHDQVLAFAENRTIIEALNEFRTAYNLAQYESISAVQQQQLAEYYRREFIPRLKDRMGGEPEVRHYLPDDSGAAWLQYHYLVANPNKVGRKDELIRAEGNDGYYAQVHERYHESLRSLIKKFGYYDLFLIDPESGNIIYSVFKETDFATSLLHGPYASSNFAHLIKEVMRTKERGRVRFQDYDIYIPSYGAPAAFVAVTVFDGRDIAGILALQVPSDELNDVMTSNREWELSGMGETGEVYLVGRNHLMRSDSRFLIQDRERYLQMLREIGMPDDEIQRIEKNDTTILFQPVRGETVDLALSGKTGTREVVDYRGVPVMSSYAPLRVHGMDWVILSEMDIAEVNRPIDRFRRHVMVSATILGVVITLLALLLASYVTRPIHALVAGMRRVGEGESDVRVKVASRDEFGELADSFNTMVEGIRQQKQTIEDKEQENALLLHSILPESVARRMKAGEQQIVDRIPNVSVIVSMLTGFSSLGDDEDPVESVARLNHLIADLDEAAETHGVDKIKTVGDDYIAACGLLTPRLDHDKRALEFAREMMATVQRIGHEYGLDLEMRIGIHSGVVLAGVVGRHRFTYDIWGGTVDLAGEICSAAAPGSICISGQVYSRLHDRRDGFREAGRLRKGRDGEVDVWCISTSSEDLSDA